jgi:hypothetical protein
MSKSIFVVVFSLFTMRAAADPMSDTVLIRSYLTALTKTAHARAYYNVSQLDETARYIENVFGQYADTVFMQEYAAHGSVYRNVVCSFGTANKKRIVIGAHYDVCGEQEGADDNASGVVGLLELARLLQGQKLSYRVDLVAYSLEEPPYFRTPYMGSYVHAQSLSESHAEVYGMVSFDMIGYFSDEKKSQSYPLGFLSLFYGKRGNYITLIKKMRSGPFARRFTRHYQSTGAIRAKKFTAPGRMPGISYSDHANYWKFGYSALLITDTSIFRNRNYHLKSDTMETLDIRRMANVIDGVFLTLKRL